MKNPVLDHGRCTLNQPILTNMSCVFAERFTIMNSLATHMLSKLAGLLALACIIIAMISPAQAELSTREKSEIQALIKDYIAENPEFIRDALNILAEREATQQLQLALALVRMDENDPVLGNADGDITIYEFSDYNCGYCKRLFGTLQSVIEEDKNIRLVIKEFPILAESSYTAARTALALQKQGKYAQFHIELMGLKGRIDDRIITKLAANTGADMAQLSRDAQSPEIIGLLQANQRAAQALEIQGTPALIIGDTIVPGAISKAEILALIIQQRDAKTN